MKRERNYGLDLFRMFSMFCVIILHLLGHGGALSSTSSNVNFATLWLLEAAAYPAVNCFVLLSGFVGYRNDKYCPKIRNIIAIAFSTLFYSLIFYFVYAFIFSKGLNLKQLVFSALPILSKQYWFVSAYVGMFLFSPIINLFVYKAERKMLYIASILILLLAVSSLLTDPFDLKHGYSALWFVLLYILGAILKKEDILSKLSALKSLTCIAICLSVSLGVKLALHFLGAPFSTFDSILISYCSPTVLLMAVCWMAVFSKIKTTPLSKKIISFITPSVFSVYLIHDNPYIRELFIANNFTFVNAHNPLITSASILASASVIFIVCILIDTMRVFLFKLLRIPQIAVFLEDKIQVIFVKLSKHLVEQ